MPEMLVRLKKGKTTFEVMVEEGKVAQYREGKVKNLSEVVVAEVVWVNANKGKRASAEQLTGAFGTADTMSVLETIVKTGDSQESDGERKGKLAEKRQEVINYITKNYVDPATKKLLPVTRVENALSQVKARIDPDVDAQRQVTALVPKLSAVLPMKKGGSSVAGVVIVATKLASATSSAIRKHATVHRENYDRTQCRFEVEVHDQGSFLEDVGKATKGDFEFVVDNPVGTANVAPVAAAAAGSGGKKKSKKGKRK